MLIPNVKFLVLPLVALAVIAALPSTATTKPQGHPVLVATPVPVVPVTPVTRATACDHRLRCQLAAQLSDTTAVR